MQVKATLLRWFLKIEEPRVQRLLFLVFYLVVILIGLAALFDEDGSLYQTGGPALIISLGGFFLVGGVCGTIAILPGIWWLERVGLVSLAFGLAARAILITILGVSPVGALIFISEVVLLAIRFLQIRKADLAPIAE